jgi:hypothetical protein
MVYSFASVGFGMERICPMESSAQRRKSLVCGSSNNKHNWPVGDFISFCVQQKEQERTTKVIQ